MEDFQAQLDCANNKIASLESRFQRMEEDIQETQTRPSQSSLAVMNASCPTTRGYHFQKKFSFEEKEIMHVGWGYDEDPIANIERAMATLNEKPYILPYYSKGAYGAEGKKFKGLYEIVGKPQEVTNFEEWKKWADDGRGFDGDNGNIRDEEVADWFGSGGIGIYFHVYKISNIEISYEEGISMGLRCRPRFNASRKCKCVFDEGQYQIVNV